MHHDVHTIAIVGQNQRILLFVRQIDCHGAAYVSFHDDRNPLTLLLALAQLLPVTCLRSDCDLTMTGVPS